MAGHSRLKNGVALLAYVPAIYVFVRKIIRAWMAGTSPAMTTMRSAFFLLGKQLHSNKRLLLLYLIQIILCHTEITRS